MVFHMLAVFDRGAHGKLAVASKRVMIQASEMLQH